MSNLPTRNRLYRWLWTGDAIISSSVFDVWMRLRDWGSAYSSWLYRWFAFRGPRRWLVHMLAFSLNVAIVIGVALMAKALPAEDLSGDIWNRNRPYAITFTDQDGKLIGRRGISQNDSIPLSEFPPVLIKAVLATEDARFYDHFGVDLIGTLRALVHNTRGGSKQGGSSITQQVVKNLLLTPERTFTRKVHEAFLSLWVEERLSKDEILKLYLDRSYLGGGNTGVEAASQFYFGKSVRDINLPEAAVLAGLFKAPTQYAPHANPEASRLRTNTVLYRMLNAGFISQGELLEAKRSPAQIVQQNALASPNWFLDWAYQDTLAVLDRQGLKNDYVLEVKTTINSRLQDASQAILNDVVDNQGPPELFTQAASITMSPDGAVRAIVGGRDYGDSQFNRAVVARRQVGSSFKPFVYLTALEHGYTRKTVIEDGPVCVGDWCVHNFEPGYRGNVQLWEALTHSINTVAVKLMVEFGRKTVEATAHRLGLTGQIDQYPTMAIGTSALTLIDMATGYSTIAAGGKLAKPYAVLEIRKPTGELLYSHAANEKDAPQVAAYDKVSELVSMMHDVVMQGTATRAQLGYAPVAGKTGTNANFRDAWFFGFTAHHVTGVWVGNDDNSSMASGKENAVTGGHVPAPAWKRIMDVAEFGLKPEALPGVPMDATYTPPLTALADPALPASVATSPAAAAAAAAAPAAPAAPTVDEEAAAMANAGSPDQNDAEAQSLLNSMADLFQTSATPSMQPQHASAAHPAKKRVPLPHAPAKPRSLLDLLFGIH
ncbi:MAG: PBP1A family penicillin-binding protein [Alphaproteobacteria bacterium]|nr:PBP1A family penicillin-binding protein [Alphaproteobacteria bacterium]